MIDFLKGRVMEAWKQSLKNCKILPYSFCLSKLLLHVTAFGDGGREWEAELWKLLCFVYMFHPFITSPVAARFLPLHKQLLHM